MIETPQNGNGYQRPGLPVSDEQFVQNMQAHILNMTSIRSEFLRRSLSMDPRRNLEQDCGYPEGSVVDPWVFRDLYDREPIATRVVELMPKECWQVQPTVYEDEDPDNVTEFEEAWDNLSKELRGDSSWFQDEEGSPIWEYLYRVDKLSGIGTYGILLLGFDDGKAMYEPLEGMVTDKPTKTTQNMGADPVLDPKELEYAKEFFGKTQSTKLTVNMPNPSSVGTMRTTGGDGYQTPVGTIDSMYLGVQYSPAEYPAIEPSKKPRKLVFIRPFDQSLVQITQWEANIRSPRFGQPIMYRVTLNDYREQTTGIGMAMATVQVHWSRVLHVADNLNSSEVIGVPRIRPVLNPVLDIKKVRGAAGEGYWKGGFPGLAVSTHPQLGGDVPVDVASMKDMMENYQNTLQRSMLLVGMDAKTLPPAMTDPTPYVNVLIEAVCIQLACPVRVFRGSERGELASTQDDSAWNDRLRHRQNSYITPRLIVPFVDRLIMCGVLPTPKKGRKVVANRRLNVFKRGPNVYNADTGKIVDGSGVDKGSTVTDTKGGYSVLWPDLDSLGDKDKAAIALQETQAVATYVSGGIENNLSPKDFWTEIMGRDEEKAEQLVQSALNHHEEALDAHSDISDQAEEQDLVKTPPTGFENKPEPPPPMPGMPGMPGGPPPSPFTVKPGDKAVHPQTGKTIAQGNPQPKPPVKNLLEEEEMTQGDRTDTITNEEWPMVFNEAEFVDNSFCPTGEGGGVNPSCSPGGSAGTTEKPDPVADLKNFKKAISHPDITLEHATLVAHHVLGKLSPKEAKAVAGEVSGSYGITSKKSAIEKVINDLHTLKSWTERASGEHLGLVREILPHVAAAHPAAMKLVERARGVTTNVEYEEDSPVTHQGAAYNQDREDVEKLLEGLV